MTRRTLHQELVQIVADRVEGTLMTETTVGAWRGLSETQTGKLVWSEMLQVHLGAIVEKQGVALHPQKQVGP